MNPETLHSSCQAIDVMMNLLSDVCILVKVTVMVTYFDSSSSRKICVIVFYFGNSQLRAWF